MLGHHLPLMEHAELITSGANSDWPAHQGRRCRIAVAVELNPCVGTDDGRHDLVGVEGNGRQLAEQRPLVLEAIHWPLAGCLMDSHIGHLVEPARCESQVVLEADQLLTTSGQGIVLDVADASLDDSLRFRVATFARDRLQAIVATQGQELGVEAGGAARAVEHGSLQVVKDHSSRTAPEELKGIDQPAVELRLALRERKVDEHQPAITKHGHEHRNSASRGSDLYPAA